MWKHTVLGGEGLEHKKTYYKKEWETEKGTIFIEGPLAPEEISKLNFHEGLVAFRPPEEQKKALIEIAGLEEGRIIVARDGNTVVGYVTYLYPDPLESWSEGNMENLLELGAIEVTPPYRSLSIGKQLLMPFHDGRCDGRLHNYFHRVLLALGFERHRVKRLAISQSHGENDGCRWA